MSDERPAIGISTNLTQAAWGDWNERAALLPCSYLTVVQRAGGMPVMIPPDPALEQEPGQMLDLLDALILSGGNDIDPSFYDAERHPMTTGTVPERDRVELALARAAVARDMPVLGICRGMQLLNVAYGGTLIQDLPDVFGHEHHRRVAGSFENSDHDVRLEPGSLAAAIAGEALHSTKSHHHQGVDRPGEGLVITGRSVLDDLAEAIEDPSRTFVLGVQWHPEADPHSPFIDAVVGAAAAYRDRRPAQIQGRGRGGRGGLSQQMPGADPGSEEAGRLAGHD